MDQLSPTRTPVKHCFAPQCRVWYLQGTAELALVVSQGLVPHLETLQNCLLDFAIAVVPHASAAELVGQAYLAVHQRSRDAPTRPSTEVSYRLQDSALPVS